MNYMYSVQISTTPTLGQIQKQIVYMSAEACKYYAHNFHWQSGTHKRQQTACLHSEIHLAVVCGVPLAQPTTSTRGHQFHQHGANVPACVSVFVCVGRCVCMRIEIYAERLRRIMLRVTYDDTHNLCATRWRECV